MDPEPGSVTPGHGLSQRQCECLRLVARDRASKEIARILGISPETVDKHIAAALRKLGSNDRYAAARWLAAQEGRTHPLVIPPDGAMADVARAASQDFVPYRSAAPGPRRLRDHSRPFGVGDAPAEPVPERGLVEEESNGVGPFRVVLWIAIVAASLAIVGSAAKPLGEGFQALSNLVEPYH